MISKLGLKTLLLLALCLLANSKIINIQAQLDLEKNVIIYKSKLFTETVSVKKGLVMLDNENSSTKLNPKLEEHEKENYASGGEFWFYVVINTGKL